MTPRPPIYTGIGSRSAPPDVLVLLRSIAVTLAVAGWTLRSGGANGADSAFEAGADDGGGAKEIYLPWRGFNDNPSPLHSVGADALMMASAVHPAFARLTQGPRKLHARNCYQVLGARLNWPADLVICWTADGCETEVTRTRDTGGAGTAIVLAARRGVPVFNLANETSRDALVSFLAERDVRLELPTLPMATAEQPRLF